MTQLEGQWHPPIEASTRVPSPLVVITHLLGLYLSLLVVVFVVAPTLDHQIPVLDSRFLFDSIAYFRNSHDFVPQSLLSPHLDFSGGVLVPSLGLTNSLILLQGRLALALIPSAPHVAILAMNYALLVLALRNLRQLAEVLGLAWTRRIQILIVLNPFIWMNLVTLTKEAWGIFFVSAFALAAVRRHLLSLVVLAALSMFVRESYVFLALGMYLVVVLPGRRALWLPIVVSLAMGMVHMFLGEGNVVANAGSKSSELGQRSADIMQSMAHLQGYPFGHLLAAPIVLLINIASPALNLRYYQLSVGDLYNVTDTVSSILFIALIIIGLRSRWHSQSTGRLWNRDVLFRLLIAFATLVTLYPISQHRYLLPVYPLLVLWALAEPCERGDSARRRNGILQRAVTAGAGVEPWRSAASS